MNHLHYIVSFVLLRSGFDSLDLPSTITLTLNCDLKQNLTVFTILIVCFKFKYSDHIFVSVDGVPLSVLKSQTNKWVLAVADPENFGGGDLKPKPQNFGCLHQS